MPTLTNLGTLYWRVSSIFRKKHIASICGHRTKQFGTVVTPLGEKYEMLLPLSDDGRPEYCLACIGKMAIQCTWCGKSICIGEPVTLYSAKETFIPPDYAIRYHEDENRFVGCLRWECGDGMDRQGFWYPPGKVLRTASPIEMILANIAGGNTSQALIVDNLSDPNDSGRFVDISGA